MKILEKIKKPETIVLAAIFLLAFYFTLPSFSQGYIASWDGPAHLVRAEHFMESLNLNELGIFGWYNGWYLGVAPFVFYPPGFFILVSFVKALSLGFLETEFIIKIILSLTFALFPILLYWLSRVLGFSNIVSLAAAIISLSFSAVWGIGLEGIYSIGLYTNIFSLLPFMLFWGLLHKCFFEKGNEIHTGILLGITIIFNIVTAIFSFILIFSYLLLFLATNKKFELKKVLKIIFIGIFLSLFWLYPFLSSSSLFGSETAFAPFGLRELVKKLIYGEIIFHSFVSILATVGVIYSALEVFKDRKKSFPKILLVFLLAVTIFLSSNFMSNLTSSWQNSTILLEMAARAFRSLLRTRALAFLWIIVPIISALGVSFILKISLGIIKRKNEKFFPAMALSILLIFSYSELSESGKAVKTTDSQEYGEKYFEFRSAFLWLKENADKNSIVMTDVNWGAFDYPGTISIDSLINLESGLRTLKGNQIEAMQINIWYLDHMEFSENPADMEQLHKFNVDYVFSYRKPEHNISYMKKVYQSENIIIYRVKGLSGKYELIEEKIGSNKYSVKINLPKNGNVELSLHYNNHWHAIVNGRPAEIKKGNSGLVELNLKSGENKIEFSFEKNFLEIPAFFISGITIIFSLFYMIKIPKKIYK